MFSRSNMKRSPSELALEEFISETDSRQTGDKIGETQESTDIFYKSDYVAFGFKDRDMNEYDGITNTFLWSQSIISSVDSQSSFCADKPKLGDNIGRGTTSGSSHEISDEEDFETEAGQCEESSDPNHLKRIRRKVSNRESARRSRRRKQAQLVDLELQVDQMKGENATLFKQLIESSQQYRNADTNNRVLRSDVEALRAKVKLAEDLVTRGSVSCNLNQLLQSHLSLSAQAMTNHIDNASFAAGRIIDNGQANFGNNNINNNRIASDSVSCVSDIWP